MGTGQTQAVRSVGPTIRTKGQLTDKQKQEQKQSLELCQTLITSAIGCIAYIRGLLPEHSFETISYNSRVGKVTDGVLDQGRAGGTHLKVLKRGDSTQADQVLDWVENGIFDALEKGFLQAFQFVVFLEADRPEIVYEAYTFSINYQTLLDGTILGVAGMNVGNITSFGKETNEQYDFSLPEARKTLQIIMRRLIAMTQNLDALPEVKYLTVRLYHTKSTPADYSPPMFEPSSGKNLKFLETLKTGVRSYNFGKLDTGLHSMNVNVATSEKRANSTEVDHISYKRSRLHYVRADKLIIEPSINRSCSNTNFDACAPADETILDVRPLNDICQVQNVPVVQLQNNGRSHGAHNNEEHNESLTKKYHGDRVQKEVALLQKMNVTQRQPTDIVPTQEIVHREQVLSQMTASTSLIPVSRGIAVETRQAEHLIEPGVLINQDESIRSQYNMKWSTAPETLKDSNTDNHEDPVSNGSTVSHTQKVVASTERAELNELKLQELRLLQRRTSKGSHAKLADNRDDIIKCECGVKKEIDDLVCCFVCNTWQHLHCYGYFDEHDKRLSKHHACYSCLLSKNEPELLKTMANLAFLRHGIHMIDKSRTKTFSTDQNISEKLGCDIERVVYMREFLIGEGYLHKASYTEASTRTRSSKTRAEVYEIVKTDDSKEKMRTMFFNPLLNIEHHYSLPETVRHEMPPDDNSDQSTDIHDPLFAETPRSENISHSLPLSKVSFIPASHQSPLNLPRSDTSGSRYSSLVPESQDDNTHRSNRGRDVQRDYIVTTSSQVDVGHSIDRSATQRSMVRTAEHAETEESLDNIIYEEQIDDASVSEAQYKLRSPAQWRMSDVRDPIHTSVRI